MSPEKLRISLTPSGDTALVMQVLYQSTSIERGSNIFFDLGDVCLVSLAGPEISTKMRANTIMVWTWGIDASLDSLEYKHDFGTRAKRDEAIRRIEDCVRLYNEQA